MSFDYEEAFSRNIGWVTNREQQILKNSTVAIAGMGGVGGAHLLTLARMGVGNFHISDFDIFEVANFNRQAGAFISTVNKPKSETLAKMAKDINPELNITIFEKGIDEDNVDQFLNGVDLYLDGLDFFAVSARRLVFNKCTQAKIPAVTAAPLGMGSAVLNFLPGKMTFEEYFCMEGHDEFEQLLRFLVGLSPAMLQRSYLADKSTVDFIKHKGPSTPMACDICAGIAATQVLKILLDRGKVIYAPKGLHFDAFNNKYVKTWRPGGNKNPIQKVAIYIARKIILHDSNKISTKEFTNPSNSAFIHKIIEAGIRAPSGDNCQPWKFLVINDNELEISIDNKNAKSFFDVNHAATYISIGAVIKNMEIAARHYLSQLNYKIINATSGEFTKATITLTPHFYKHPPLPDFYQSMRARTVNRRPYLPHKLPDSTWKELIEVGSSNTSEIVIYKNKNEIKKWVKAIKSADIIRWSHPEIHNELFDKIRYSQKQAEELRTGLEIDRLGAGPGAKYIMKFLSSWSRMQNLNKIKAPHMLAEQTAFLARASSGLVGVWINEDSPEQWIETGRIIESLWVNAKHLGLEIQPLPVAAYLERKHQLSSNKDIFTESHQTQLTVIKEIINEFRPNPDSATCAMLFRVGKGIPMKGTAIRQSVDKFITSL